MRRRDLIDADWAPQDRLSTGWREIVDLLQEADQLAAGAGKTTVTAVEGQAAIDGLGIISTFEETKSGWLRTDLVERIRRSTGKPVEHVVQGDIEAARA